MRTSGGPPTIAALMLGLARLGLLGFGGVGPQAYHVFVERSRWLSPEEFAEGYGLAQALPGANVVNLCAIMGDRWFGPLGAVAAVGAITVPPLVVVLLAAATIARVGRAPRVVAAEGAIVAASAGLLLATAYRVLTTIARRRVLAAAIAAMVAYVVAAHVANMPVATVVAVGAGWCVDALDRARRMRA
jgi:chromate transporter